MKYILKARIVDDTGMTHHIDQMVAVSNEYAADLAANAWKFALVSTVPDGHTVEVAPYLTDL